MSTLAKIAEVELELGRTQRNKATEYHVGLLKAKLARLKSEVVAAATKGSGGRAGDGFDVTKVGDVRAGMIGFPSVGKSSLLTRLTGTRSEVASYEFTTLTWCVWALFARAPDCCVFFCAPGGSTAAAHFPPPRRSIPGTIYYRGARIQLLDMPGIIEGAKDGKGRGKQVISTARTCDVILIVLDASKPMTHKRIIERELEGFGIRLNKTPPNIVLTRKEKGGVMYRSAMPQPHLDEECVRARARNGARARGRERARARALRAATRAACPAFVRAAAPPPALSLCLPAGSSSPSAPSTRSTRAKSRCGSPT